MKIFIVNQSDSLWLKFRPIGEKVSTIYFFTTVEENVDLCNFQKHRTHQIL